MKKRTGLHFSLILLVGCIAVSCSASKKTAAKSSTNENATVKGPLPPPSHYPNRPAKSDKSGSNSAEITSSEKSLGALQFKYAILLDVPVEEIDNRRLFSFIDSWYGTPYRYGGFTRDGVDCSGFTQNFMTSIYQIQVPRVSAEQYNQSKRITRRELREGDLVFFKTSGRSISHVGIYLRNNKFVHASTSSGVMISDLDEDYFARRYAGAGRVK
ncbi:MAG: NlpC/P60 family protein [Flavitalea sp.]